MSPPDFTPSLCHWFRDLWSASWPASSV